MLNIYVTHTIKKLLRNQAGVAALELAFVLPIFILLMFGGFEAWHYIMSDQRADRVSSSVADLASRIQDAASEPVINDILDGGAFIGKPVDFTNDAVIRLTAVNGGDSHIAPAERNKILWCRIFGDPTIAASTLGAVNSTADLSSISTAPAILNDESTLLVAEVAVKYTSTFMSDILPNQVIKRVAIYPARSGAVYTLPVGGAGAHPCP